MHSTQLSTRRWTCDEFERLVEAGILRPDERLELLDGEIVPMSPQSPRHSLVLSEATGLLVEAFTKQYRVRVQCPLGTGGSSQPEPDIAVVEANPGEQVNRHPTTAVLVAEVSDTSLATDKGIKATLYAGAGVPEYWVLNLPERRLEVHRDAAPVPGQADAWSYRSVQVCFPGESVTPLHAPGHSIAVAELLP